MWKIYGKKYDLTNFAKHHPGGAEIIEKTKGLDDCTALFETYHAFSDLDAIKQSLAKYELGESENNITEYTTDFTTYRKLTERIKTVFPDRASIKAPPSWYMWNGFALCAFLYTMYYTIVSKYVIIKYFFAIIFASIEVSIMFNILHDGSHYAITPDPLQNNILSTIANSWILWNHSIWLYQHVYYHHSFTGGEYDSDKVMYDIGTMIKTPTYFEWIYNFIYCFIPGQSNMQVIWYIYTYIYKQLSFTKNDILKIPNDTTYYDNISLSIMMCKLAFFISIGIIPTLIVLATENTLYYINIFPNHNLYETHENHYDGNDWAKRQICNSGNFVNGNPWWTVLFSGINHQIEHHLFPNISGHHYTIIAPIVREFCREHNIPYVHHPTLVGAYKSFMKKNALKKLEQDLAKPLENELPRKESSESHHSDEWVQPEKEE
jgi:linoleoyl-CoA desaturase